MPRFASPTDKALTSHDIAKAAGVSQTTVSRVLRGSNLVQPETRQLVLDVIAKLGYLPSPAARSMRTRRTNTIALVVSNLALNPLYPVMLQLLSSALRRQGLYATIWEAEQIDEDTMRALSELPVDGVIVATAMDAALPFLETIAERKPLILINRTVSSDKIDQISSDNMSGGALVAAYFHEHGRQTMGLITTQARPSPSPIRDREAGFLAELARRGIELDSQSIVRVPHFSYQTGFDAAQQLLRQKSVDCVFCVNDIIGIGALDGVRAQGISVPEQIWMVGYDDIPMSSWHSVGLTTVRQPIAMMVDAAVERLCARLKSNTLLAHHALLPAEIVIRPSSG